MVEPAGATPKRQAKVPSVKVSCWPVVVLASRTSSDIATEMTGPPKVKSNVVVFEAREQGT